MKGVENEEKRFYIKECLYCILTDKGTLGWLDIQVVFIKIIGCIGTHIL